MKRLGLLFIWQWSILGAHIDNQLDYYIAAAFQNAIVGEVPSGINPRDRRAIQHANLAKFDRAMEEARAHGTDIIVFNEGGVDPGLWGPDEDQVFACEQIPEPSPNFIPCSDEEGGDSFPITHNASCLARKHGIVTVLNICDRQPCQKGQRPCTHHSDINCCPSSGYELFNTQLAFSETGQLLAKYHKVHNYDTAPDSGETSNGLCCWPPRLDYAYFDTHFGVRFGMHICFDIMFRTPGLAMALNETLGIQDFVYSTHWETTGPPMLPGTEIQQAWSRALGVNLIAANAGEGYAHAGSGIYSKGRTLAVRYKPEEAEDDYLLISKVPKLLKKPAVNVVRRSAVTSREEQDPPSPLPAFKAFDVHTSSERKQSVVVIASGTFVCNFTFVLPREIDAGMSDRFLLMAVNGSWMGKDNLHSRSCVVVRCGHLSEADCAARASCSEYQSASCAGGRSLYNNASDLVAYTRFERFSLHGNFEAGDVVMPVVGTSMGELVDSEDITIDGGEMHVSLQKPLLNAMLFAIPDYDHVSRPEERDNEMIAV